MKKDKYQVYEEDKSLFPENVIVTRDEIVEKEINSDGKITNCYFVNYRKEPDINSESYGVLKNGTLVKIIASIKDYYKISINGKEAYIPITYVEV